MSGTPIPDDNRRHRSRPAPVKPWWRRPWIVPLAIATIAFLIYALPPYVSLDPATSRIDVPAAPIYYPALVIHIFAGSVMLCCAVLQLWPWLRRRHLPVHRWSGRLYMICAIPVFFGGLIVAQFPQGGPVQQVANTMLGLLFGTTTALGYRAVRQRRIGDHREWMIRSFALASSIVANRVWTVICVAILSPNDEPDGLTAAIGIATWLSWVVNLIIAEAWLHRRNGRRQRPARRDNAPRTSDSSSDSDQHSRPVAAAGPLATEPQQ
ncbi:DUF2306 domain-containing protein [Microlunatus soli]|uniref:Predicted membrane protein n=1 Tax=Microlunatus soli TaxID=630515 RepID=A0A1H1QRI9_9ACTN|nr:DUF2306 domain-containing protein [Microlunatus soli]SDS26088.1 Predicted membrane protein [Microlunatus soli]